MKIFFKNFLKKIAAFTIEIYLISFIILNLLDFAGQLPGEIEFLKRMLSWIIVIHLVLGVSLTEIFFGIRKRFFDYLLVLTFSILSLQSFVYYAVETMDIINLKDNFITTDILINAFLWIESNLISIISASKYVGFSILLILSIFFSIRFYFSEKSVLGVLHEEGPPKASKFLFRFILTFIVLNAFSAFIFKLLLEWFGWAVDAPLLVIGLSYWVYLNIKHYLMTGKLFRFYMFLEHVSNFGEKFLKNFISLFHYKNTFYIGFIGLLIFHSLTDVGAFIIPYITGIEHSFYGSIHSLQNHTPLFFGAGNLFINDIQYLYSSKDIIVLLAGYILNIFAIVFLMLLPAYFWYSLYKNKNISLKIIMSVIFAISLTFFLLSPCFSIDRIEPGNNNDSESSLLMGVDIKTNSLLDGGSRIVDSLSLSLLAGFIVFAFSQNIRIKKFIDKTIIFLSMVLFGVYTYNYFISIYQYLIQGLKIIINSNQYFLAAIVFIDLFLIFILYFPGYIIFFYYVLIKKKKITASYDTSAQ